MTKSNQFIIWYPDDYCINCKSNTLQLVTSKNNKCSLNNYSDTISYDYIICNKCGKKYNIDWSNKKPKPLRDGSTEINDFLYKWKK